jgi:dephospho-CoA kinase
MQHPILKVGITGGIGSGKTTVCRIFESLGIPVYYADDRAKQLMVEDEVLRGQIQNLFGAEAYLPDGNLNRQYIASQAFSQPHLLQRLNALVHPAVAKDSLAWHEQQSGVPYTLKEAALLYESGSDQSLDKIITVTAPEALRIQRVMQRDGSDEAAVRARIDKQMPEEEKVKRADYVIYNDGKQLLLPQIQRIHQALIQL